MVELFVLAKSLKEKEDYFKTSNKEVGVHGTVVEYLDANFRIMTVSVRQIN